MDTYLPTLDDISKGAEVATTPESKSYLRHSFTKRISKADKAMQAASVGIIENLKINEDMATELNSDKAWINGEMPQKTRETGAESKALSIGLHRAMETNHIEEIDVDLAISKKDGEIKYASSFNHNPLEGDPAAITNDLLLNHLEAGHYQVDVRDERSFLQYDTGKAVKGDDVDEAVEMIMNPETGFEAYLQQYGTRATVRMHPFPGEEPLAIPSAEAPGLESRHSPDDDEVFTIE
ncbi:hypothetical protein BN59_00794 [Legionella massiliensis]|uniref:Uncharacterized protein n=1 Tax=Legionella massiliensis TaxID=1034943 RepID=A0A078KXP5_9GAMM|nr:hypothetical protein [Legionella massiliensis]CDZ76524.1 hypothetical protein BN59_00794 [Legionella massiliensis]CEE12262.1 hypothetical protein BN1094_00794 [Legionella massiliensis]